MFFSDNHYNIDHCFFSKLGGTSYGKYSSLNCGKGSYDNKTKIKNNFNIVANYFDLPIKNIITLQQTHSNKVLTISHEKHKELPLYFDGIVTNRKNLILGILTADCAPVLFFDPINNIIGASHVGWRGALNGILENTLYAMKNLGSRSKDIRCAVGPCIGHDSYEVGLDFYNNFLKENNLNKKFFESKNKAKYRFSLRKYITNKLTNLNVKDIDSIRIDTFKYDDMCFSYRKSLQKKENDYGRMISTIVIKD